MKVSILALSVLVGGAVLASASSAPTVYTTYSVSASETNLVATSAYWSVDGTPTTPSGAYSPEVYNSVDCSTDGSGKIVGAGMVYLAFGTNIPPYSLFTASVSGKISQKGSTTTVSMQIKGTGMTVNGDGTGQPASYTVSFTGSPVPNPDTNSTQPLIIGGTASVTIKGTTPLGPKSFTAKSVPMTINDNSAFLNSVNFDASVLQNIKSTSSGTMQIFGDSFTGKANIKSGTYTASIKGVGSEAGLTLTVQGTMGVYTNSIGTNAVLFTAPTTANITKGKINGQTVTGVAFTRVTANLLP